MFIEGPPSCLKVFTRLRARPIGAFVLGLFLVLSLGASARPRQRSKKKPRHEPEKPLTLKLESFDRPRSKAVVLVGGLGRAPASRFFTFHDDRNRHFIALGAACTPAEGGFRCSLDLPPSYLKRSRIVGMSAHLRGREITADASEVAAVFSASSTAHDPPDGGANTVDGTEIGWELRGDASWHQEDESDDVDTEEWRYLNKRK